MAHSIRIRRGALAALVALAVASCGGTSTTAPAPKPTSPYPTQDPHAVAGGTLTLGVWQPPQSFLDAGIIDSQPFSYLIDAPVSEGLLWYRGPAETAHAKSPADYYQPWLATEIPTVQNGDIRTYGCPNLQAKMCVTWKLRNGVQWHDGSSLSSKDVCDTYQLRWLAYHDKSPTPLFTTSQWSAALDCKQQDPLTAVVDFNQTLGPYLALGSGAMGILPATELDPAIASQQNIEGYAPNVDLTLGSHNSQAYKGSNLTLDAMMDGTGPYVFKSADANDIVFVKNDNYWNKSHQPHVNQLVFKTEADQASELADLKAGAIDMAFDIGTGNVPALSNASGPSPIVQTVLDSAAEKIDINICADDTNAGTNLCGPQASQNPYTADPAIRRAMREGINRPAIADKETNGKSPVPQDSSLSLGASWINDPHGSRTPYDPSKARADLDTAGDKINPTCGTDSAGDQFRSYRDGTCIAVNLGTTTGDASRADAQTMVAADLGKIGIRVVSPFAPNLAKGVFFGSFTDGGPLYTHKFDLAIYGSGLLEPGEPDSSFDEYHGDCVGACLAGPPNGITSPVNPAGRNDTGLNDSTVDSAFDAGRVDVDPAQRAKDYRQAQAQLATDTVEIPLYQRVTINAFTPQLRGILPNDFAWDYNSYDWYCAGGNCQG